MRKDATLPSRYRFFQILTLWILIGALAPGALAAYSKNSDLASLIRFPVEKYKLANGMVVILQVDHSAPLISYQTWFRVGSKNEEPGFTGIAHLFEHMMFKGAKRYSGPQFDELLQSNGATNNAGTTHDYTYYYENLPAGKLELAIDLESDRMQSLQITDPNLASEREVVKEERRFRVDNNPMGFLREAVFGAVFRVSPYRWPVIGYMPDIQNITREKAQEFYKTYYAPNNAIIVVAGDFQPAEAKSLIEKYYGAIPAQTIPAGRARPNDPAQTAGRAQAIEKDVQSPTFSLSFHAPKDGVEDAYALDLLSNILGHGPSSRLHRRLVYKDQIANEAAAYNETLQDAGLFQIVVSVKPGGDWKISHRAALGELWRTRKMLVSATELEAAKNQTMKALVDSLKTAHGRAEVLGINEVFHDDYEELFRVLDRYGRVTPEMIRKAASLYLQPTQATLVSMNPLPKIAVKKQGAHR